MFLFSIFVVFIANILQNFISEKVVKNAIGSEYWSRSLETSVSAKRMLRASGGWHASHLIFIVIFFLFLSSSTDSSEFTLFSVHILLHMTSLSQMMIHSLKNKEEKHYLLHPKKDCYRKIYFHLLLAELPCSFFHKNFLCSLLLWAKFYWT